MSNWRALSVSKCQMRNLALSVLAAAAVSLSPGAALAGPPSAGAKSTMTVTPSAFRLRGLDAVQQFAVSVRNPGGARVVDQTESARFYSLDPRIARVSKAGVVTPVGDGTTRIRIRLAGLVTDALVSVRDTQAVPQFSFANDITPILSKFGCNSGACHGKAEGKNGFKLSIFGYDPPTDHHAVTMQGAGRRVNRAEPGASLILLKPTGLVSHGGGQRFRPDSREARLIHRWIQAGALGEPEGLPAVTGIQVFPSERSLSIKAGQQLVVTARYSDGSVRDVTSHAVYSSNDDLVVTVDERGRVSSLDAPGEAAVMVTYLGQVGVSRIVVPRTEQLGDYPELPVNNFVDKLAWAKLRKLRIVPSDLATDAEFMRRAYLDCIGTLPTPEEARAFLAEQRPDRRARLVDALLERPEYADYWALKWADILRVNKEKLGAKGAHAFHVWLRRALAENMPYDQFVREIVTASGDSSQNGPVNYYRVLTKPQDLANSISQALLGVRIECAQCHHHPFERWTQNDYYGMVAFFTQLKLKGQAPHSVTLMPSGNAEAIHPKTKQPVPPHPLDEDASDLEGITDRRQRLAEWMTAPDNPYLARMISNRLWAHFLGRGIVDPVDDFRNTNPPTNPELLDALSRSLVESKFDLKELIRTIMNSRVYQLSSQANATNAADRKAFSRAYPKRMSAEVMMDAIASATGVPPDLPGLPPGTRAIQIWDSEWSSQWQSYFLNVFGRPTRTSPCECERTEEPSIAQTLHLMNSPKIQQQIAHRYGRARELAQSDLSPPQIVAELFLATYSRLPSAEEEQQALAPFDGSDRVRATEDVLWALMNSLEFVFVH